MYPMRGCRPQRTYRFACREREVLRPRLLSTRNLEPIYRVDNTLRAFALVKARKQRPAEVMPVPLATLVTDPVPAGLSASHWLVALPSGPNSPE